MKIEKEIFPAGTDSRFFREVGMQLSIIYVWYISVATVLKYFVASYFFRFSNLRIVLFTCSLQSSMRSWLSCSFILLSLLFILSYRFDSDSGRSCSVELRSFFSIVRSPQVSSLQPKVRSLHNRSYLAPSIQKFDVKFFVLRGRWWTGCVEDQT